MSRFLAPDPMAKMIADAKARRYSAHDDAAERNTRATAELTRAVAELAAMPIRPRRAPVADGLLYVTRQWQAVGNPV